MLVQESLKITALLAAPVLLAGMVSGLVMSLIQTVTSIQEQTLTFVPKTAACLVVTALALPWQLEALSSYTERLYSLCATFGH